MLKASSKSNANVAVLVVDMQFKAHYKKPYSRLAFFSGPLIDDRNATKGICRVVETAKKSGISIVLVGSGARENMDSDILEAAGPSATFIEKRKPDAFSVPRLAKMLRSKNINTLVICGTSAIACVYSTTKGALGNGFRVITGYGMLLDWRTRDLGTLPRSDWLEQFIRDIRTLCFYIKETEFYMGVKSIVKRLEASRPA